MAALVKGELFLARLSGWFEQLGALLSHELAPTSRKLRTALRIAAISTIGVGLIAICHVDTEWGAFLVWLLVGTGPMMRPFRAMAFLIPETVAAVINGLTHQLFSDTLSP
jgi:hypothetical protein